MPRSSTHRRAPSARSRRSWGRARPPYSLSTSPCVFRARRSGIAISGGSQAAEVVDVLRARFTGLDGPSAARFIPPEVATLRREKLALFLNRLLAATGEISGEGENLTLDAEMLSARIARQAQHLLLRFGVVSVVAGNQLRIGPAGMVPLIREVGVFGRERPRPGGRNHT